MVHEPQLKPLLTERERPLEQIGRALIAAANEAGGRDNITVILFRLEEVEDRRAPARRRRRPRAARHGASTTRSPARRASRARA